MWPTGSAYTRTSGCGWKSISRCPGVDRPAVSGLEVEDLEVEMQLHLLLLRRARARSDLIGGLTL
jgi:hypothetical protein